MGSYKMAQNPRNRGFAPDKPGWDCPKCRSTEFVRHRSKRKCAKCGGHR
jgi:hypothetical protein